MYIHYMNTSTASRNLLVGSVLRHPPLERAIVSKDFTRMRWDDDVAMLHVDPGRFVPIEKMNDRRRRPMTNIKVVKDDSEGEIAISKLIAVPNNRSVR